jgi:hypothetical protein
MTEKRIETLQKQLDKAKKEFGDVTLAEAHRMINYAASCLERTVTNGGYSFSKPRAKFLIDLAGKMRNDAEDALGPQPDFGPRKTIPKRSPK